MNSLIYPYAWLLPIAAYESGLINELTSIDFTFTSYFVFLYTLVPVENFNLFYEFIRPETTSRQGGDEIKKAA